MRTFKVPLYEQLAIDCKDNEYGLLLETAISYIDMSSSLSTGESQV